MKAIVVVVDDEPAIVDVVCDVLDEVDVEAVPCRHGSSAYCCIKETDPDALILDVLKPEVDGIEVFEHLRQNPKTSAIPVIFFTANADKLRQRLPDFREQGAALLPKPFNVDRLLELVNQALDV